jgi:hypothetical protein
MILDTNKLVKAVEDYFDQASQNADKIKDDRTAIKIMDDLEKQTYDIIDKINEIESIAERFLK